MDHIEFTTALIRLSRHKIGVAEAVTLFMLTDGVTSDTVARTLKIGKGIAKGRIGILRKKKYAVGVWQPDGTVRYFPTERGRKLIAETLTTKASRA